MKRYESPAWISAVMDDAGLTAAEFRVLAHVCRRAGDGSNGRGCDASIASMAKVCKVHPDRLGQMLKRLVELGWLEVEVRQGRSWVYTPRFPECNPPTNKGWVEENPPLECHPHPPTNKGGAPLTIEGDEGKPEVKPEREKERDSNSAPDGTAFVRARSQIQFTWEAVQLVTSDMHRRAMGNPDELFGVFPPEEVEGWARDWFLRFEATGGFMDGQEIHNPLAALTAWLRSCARRQSKRFKEVNRHGGEGIGDELPFGAG